MQYDIILRNGTIYDGSGSDPFAGDVGIHGDKIAAVGDLGAVQATLELDVSGLAVAPGFINMLSWSTESLIQDGRSQSEIRQGVTLEVMGEGVSMGPLSPAMKAAGPGSYMAQGDIEYDVEWTTLGEYLEWLEQRGVSCNIASFVGSSTLRIHTMGYEDREPTIEELDEMRRLLREAMAEGAMGMSAALIYTPAHYADTLELIDLVREVSAFNGMYISHIRSEGSAFMAALDEFLEIAREAKVTSEIYHLKASGQSNWDKMDAAIAKIEAARAEGLHVVADMYTYPYSGTGLDTCIPPWAHEGGHDAMIARLKDPATRAKIKEDMRKVTDDWENMSEENSPANILLAGFQQEHMKPLQGKTLAEVMAMRGSDSAKDTLIDLIIEDDSRIFTMYFSMSEDNLRKQVVLPWVSFCSDAESQAPEGVFLNSIPHPRAYGSFARLLAKYVREEGLVPLQEAIRRLTSFPAENLKIQQRGRLQADYFADVVVFDPATIQDHATPQNPHQYATGMQHVFVNGVPVLKDGEHTGATPGRVVRGPGYQLRAFENQYGEPVAKLLWLGAAPDYSGDYKEFNFKKEHIPDLIRMATDKRLHEYVQDEPQVWAGVHAWRVLGQLEAVEAAEPLMTLLDSFDEMVVSELPVVYTMIGAPAIPALTSYLADDTRSPIGRGMAVACLRMMGEQLPPNIYLLVESILIEQLKKHDTNNMLVNSFLVEALNGMESDMAIPVIEAAQDAGNLSFFGALDDEDGDNEEDERPRLFDVPLARVGPIERSAKKAATTKKAKRKQAAKFRKKNRKKGKKRR